MRGNIVAALLGVLLVAVVAWARGWPPPILSVDINKGRINEALPLLVEGVLLRQSFTPRHDGLREVEVQLARYEPEDAGGALTFRLLDERGQEVVRETVPTQWLSHNQLWTLVVPRQAQSAGRRYTLEVAGERSPFSLWGYTLAPRGRMEEIVVTGGSSPARALRLVTRYELSPGSAAATLAATLGREGGYLLLALAFMLLPGCLTLLLARRGVGAWEPGAWWGAALALGLALWPLLWFWLTLAGLRWTPLALWLTLALGWVAVGVLAWRARVRLALPPLPLLLLLLVGFALRLLAVRDLAFPPWVDAVRHALITAVMAGKGQVLFDYAPFLPVERFAYHFGFHVLPASLTMMTDWPLPRLLLMLGQLLNALVPLSVYSAAWLMTRQRGAALLAAFLVAIPFLFPGYYATWGRFTQLTGMLLLPVLVALTWRGVRRGGWGGAGLVGLLAAGLFLVHLRVFLYYLPVPLLLWLRHRGRGTRWLAAAGLVGGLLVAPRIGYLMPRSAPGALLANNIEGYNEFPIGYLTAGWERYFVVLALLGALASLVAAARGRRWARAARVLAAWVASLFALLGGKYIGLPESWLVNLNSMYITLFFPLSLLLALPAARLWRWMMRRVASRPAPTLALHGARGALLTLLLLFGAHHQITILNSQTILAVAEDQAALAWVAAHTPPDARFAVNSWLWLGGAWAGSDGGAWLVPLTGRASTTPPADYTASRALAAQVSAFNERAVAVEDWADPALAPWLRAEGVTHLFVGARGGFMDPAELAQNPALELVYEAEGAYIFALREP